MCISFSTRNSLVSSPIRTIDGSNVLAQVTRLSRTLSIVPSPRHQSHTFSNANENPKYCGWTLKRATPRAPEYAPTPTPNDRPRFAFCYLLTTQSFQVRFGRWRVQSTRTIRGFPEHSRSSKARRCLNQSRKPTRIANRSCGWTLPRAVEPIGERDRAVHRVHRLAQVVRERREAVRQSRHLTHSEHGLWRLSNPTGSGRQREKERERA